jgi:hypothetical protein
VGWGALCAFVSVGMQGDAYLIAPQRKHRKWLPVTLGGVVSN